jgi:hypothetical protein
MPAGKIQDRRMIMEGGRPLPPRYNGDGGPSPSNERFIRGEKT